ncbi:MAG TPA: hypothetical protein VFE42_24300 [Chloroflexota bacterium]|nr:hypothetical protein [Chloroflexota bacterium]
MVEFTIKVRKTTIYVTIGVTFLVAAMSQVQGDTAQNITLKAAVALGSLVIIAIVLLRLLDRAVRDIQAKEVAARASAQPPDPAPQQPLAERHMAATKSTGKIAA